MVQIEDKPRSSNGYGTSTKAQTVIHLAAQAIVGTANGGGPRAFETNIKGTWCVLERAAAVRHEART